MATGKPGINIQIGADASAAKAALAQTTAALAQTTDAAKQTAAAVRQINNTSQGMLDARAKVAALQLELAKLKDAAVQSGQAMKRTVVQDYKKALSAARTVVAEERDKLAKEMASKPVIIPVRAQVDAGATDPTASAKELAATKAQRQARYLQGQLAPQFTDIVVSLQGGMNPLTVLLQQGGQIKDMYALAGKSVGQALASMAQYVLGLITPVTALAAVIALATVGFVKGRAEAETFRDTLALSNNVIGTSVDALSNMAAAIDEVDNGITQGAAAEVLNQMAASGTVAAESLQGLALAALQLRRVGGPAASKTAETFAALGKEPTEALGKLNKQLGFVTKAQYEQVRALELAGKTTEAATLAQELYRQQVEKTTTKIEENLGTLERVAKATGGFFREMWDSILGIGRVETLETQIDKVEKRLEILRRAQGMGFNRAGGADTTAAEAELAALKAQKKVRDDNAAAEKAAVAKNKKEQRSSDIAFKDRGELPSAIAQAETDLALANLKRSDAEFKAEYDQALTNLETYYRDRREIIQFSNREEARLAQQQLNQAQANLSKASPEERAGASAAVVAAQSRVDVGGVQAAERLAQFDAERAQARRDLTRALNDYAIQAAALRGQEAGDAAQKLQIAQAEERYRNALAKTTDPVAQASIKAVRDNEVATAQLKAQQVALERQLAPFIQKRAELEADITAGRTSAAAGELQLFNLEVQRQALLLQELQTIRQIANLSVEQQNALDAAISGAGRGATAQGGSQELRVQQAAQEQQLLALSQRRAAIEQQIRNGKLSEVEGADQLYNLEQQRNALLLQTLQAMQQIPGLTVEQQNNIKAGIEAAKTGLAELTPIAQQLNLTIKGGLESAFADALTGVRSLKDGLRQVGQQIAQIFARRAAAQAVSGLTALFGFAEGGHVRGAGSETSDSIPARLSNNEFVMPAKAVRNYGVGFMEAIRKMQVPRSSMSAPLTVPRTARYAEGGLVSSAAVAGGTQQSYPVQVVVNNEGTPKNATAKTDFDGKSLVVSVLLNDIKNNGPVFRSMSNAQKSRR